MNHKHAMAKLGVFLLVAAPVVIANSARATPVVAAPDEASVDQAIDRALGNHQRYQTVIATLKKAVADHDATKVAEFVDYPLRVSIGGKTSRVRSAQEFVARYGNIMTPAIQQVITEQRYADLFVNSDGVMFGRGEVWLRGICKDTQCRQFTVKIVTIQDNSNLDEKNAH